MVEQEEWEYVDEVRRGSTRYSCGMVGHFARCCRRNGKRHRGRWRLKQGTRQRSGQDDERRGGRRAQHRGGPSGESGSWGYIKDSAGRAVESGAVRRGVGGESLASRRKMPTAEKVDNLSQRRMKKSEGVWRNSSKRQKAPVVVGKCRSTR